MGIFRSFYPLCGLLLAGWSSSAAGTVNLPAYPLAVKSPYLSTWVPGNQLLTSAATAQPKFWNGVELAWPILARVDGVAYTLFGAPGGVLNTTAATTNDVSYTSSHTYVHLTAGQANLVLDFFSPVLPGKEEYARQSLPYSYLTVSATSSSDRKPSVQVLSGIDHTWTGQNGSSKLNYTISGSAGFFWFHNPDEILFTERKNMATWGSVLFAANTEYGMTHGCGKAADIYSTFASGGLLPPKASTNSTKECHSRDLAAIAKDLGECGHTASTATFVVGFDRVQAISYLQKPQTGFYRTKWPTVPEAIEHVLDDYGSVFASSLAFDAAIRSKAEAVSSTFGSKYADIVEASVRQTFGGMDLTVPEGNLTYYPPDAFLKEISSDGNANTVDFIFQSWPIFISLNPEYIRLMLQPVLSYLDSGRWPQKFVIHDIGTHYPNATGHDNGREEHMPMFETSALFILLLAYQKFSGDATYAAGYEALLNAYAKWMAEPRSLYPGPQLISVDAIRPSANQTLLAVQAAIALNAAHMITGNSTYSRIAADNINALYYGGLGLDCTSPADSTHFTYNYGRDQSWNVLFPSYSDVLLDLNTFPQEAWDMQSDWYLTRIKEGGLAFAGPTDDFRYTGRSLNWGITDWNIVAASTSSRAVQQAVIDTTHAFLTNGKNNIPFGTKYIVEGPRTGVWIGNLNRASVGSHFALLALQQGTWYTGAES